MEYWPDYSDSSLPNTSHPDITDRFGRVWVWKSREIYTHDNVLMVPREFIERSEINLPHKRTANNHKYAGLCEICRSEW